jgi:hypothetical protein
MINCSEYHASQFIRQRNRDFEHEPTCTMHGIGQRPYVQLLEMLEAIQNNLPDER